MAVPAWGQKPRARIENWRLTYIMHRPHLMGQIFGHFSVSEGSNAMTSAVVSMDFKAMTAETENTIYALGQYREES